MTDSSDRYGSKPLGRSAEEIESEAGNRVNSPVPGEQIRHDEETVAVVPAVSNSNTSTTPGVIAPDALLTDALLTDSVVAGERRGPDAGQSSENSEN